MTRFYEANKIAEVLQIKRPLTFFDVETTGPWETEDRIVQLGFVRLAPNEEPLERELEFNPEKPVGESEKIHGISDEFLADKPLFRQQARQLYAEVFDGDIVAYNGRFDIRMLKAEFRRAGIDWQPGKLVDPYRIFADMEPRNLEAAVRFFLDERLDNAHTALADTRGMLRVLLAMFERYPEDSLPRDVDELDHRYFKQVPEGFVDAQRKLALRDGVLYFNFGKNVGKKVKDHRDYAEWMLGKDFSPEVKDALREALKS